MAWQTPQCNYWPSIACDAFGRSSPPRMMGRERGKERGTASETISTRDCLLERGGTGAEPVWVSPRRSRHQRYTIARSTARFPTSTMSARRQASTTSLSKYARTTEPELTSRTLDFCNAFWGLGDGGVDVLFARMRGAARTMEELRAFWKERYVLISRATRAGAA